MEVFFHVYFKPPRIQGILAQMFQYMVSSGLAKASDQIHIGLIGPNAKCMGQLPLAFRKKTSIHYWGPESRLFEFPTLGLLWDRSKQAAPQPFLYLHTKGVSHTNPKAIQDTDVWRKSLCEAALTRYRECLEGLKKNDVFGMECHWDHFSGNFWWARSQYLSKLRDPRDFLPKNTRLWGNRDFNNRYMAEFWVAQSSVTRRYNSQEGRPYTKGLPSGTIPRSLRLGAFRMPSCPCRYDPEPVKP